MYMYIHIVWSLGLTDSLGLEGELDQEPQRCLDIGSTLNANSLHVARPDKDVHTGSRYWEVGSGAAHPLSQLLPPTTAFVPVGVCT